MQAYLTRRYAEAAEDERLAFERLIDVPDPDLYDLLIGRRRLADEAMNRIADAVRAAATA
jgi:succinate dehydrogenase flavin-adding protein (antitoxin of CptAB toxin-antitoxin module)